MFILVKLVNIEASQLLYGVHLNDTSINMKQSRSHSKTMLLFNQEKKMFPISFYFERQIRETKNIFLRNDQIIKVCFVPSRLCRSGQKKNKQNNARDSQEMLNFRN